MYLKMKVTVLPHNIWYSLANRRGFSFSTLTLSEKKNQLAPNHAVHPSALILVMNPNQRARGFRSQLSFLISSWRINPSGQLIPAWFGRRTAKNGLVFHSGPHASLPSLPTPTQYLCSLLHSPCKEYLHLGRGIRRSSGLREAQCFVWVCKRDMGASGAPPHYLLWSLLILGQPKSGLLPGGLATYGMAQEPSQRPEE